MSGSYGYENVFGYSYSEILKNHMLIQVIVQILDTRQKYIKLGE